MAVAFVFPGQGSQALGMQADLVERFEPARETWAEAADALGRDLWELVSNGPAEQLDRTENTQPAMLTAGMAVWRVVRANSAAAPACLAGHSLGEWTALCAGGAMPFVTALELVSERARLMQEAVPGGVGAMAVVLGLDDAAVREACASAAGDDIVEAVNLNAPGQVVIAGHAAAVGRAVEAAKAAGARRAMTLPVSVPSHCALMRPAAERLAERLAKIDIAVPSIPVINNVDVAVVTSGEGIADALVRQLYSPVRWVETVETLRDTFDVATLVECGPGKVLAGLTRRIDRALGAEALHDADAVDAFIQNAAEGG